MLHAEIEQLLKDSNVGKMEAVPIGVIKPQRATLQDHPMCVAWKPLTPVYQQGFLPARSPRAAAP